MYLNELNTLPLEQFQTNAVLTDFLDLITTITIDFIEITATENIDFYL